MEKIDELKETIQILYEKEGKSQSYISNLLKINRKMLGIRIKEWEFIKADIKHIKPSTLKFLNKNKNNIINKLNENCKLTDLAKDLNISTDQLIYRLKTDKELIHYYTLWKQRLETNKIETKIEKEELKPHYEIINLENEIWKPVLGFENYEVSNMGRIKKGQRIIKPQPNIRNGRWYIAFYNKSKCKNMNLARVVGHAFIEGYSSTRNTINHKDGDINNNKADNLEWISQAENNLHSYHNLDRKVNKPYSKNKFSIIILDDKYEFKSIQALANFLGVSWTQASRYINKECKINHKIELF